MKSEILKIAEEKGWNLVKWQDDIKMLSFKKAGDRINIYCTTMTVGTCIRHPKLGKTQLFRKRVSLDLLKQLFDNPRAHTEKGYYLRDKK